MKLKLLIAVFGLVPVFVFAQTSTNMLGTWKGISNSAVSSSGLFHPTEAGKEKSVRFRNVEYVLVIDREEGRNFVGSIGATNSKNLTDVKHKEVILGAYAKDMKSGVMVNETGSLVFKLADSKNLEICYTQASSKPKVASCFEMVKQ
jgi:hypothetical protein